MVKGLTLRSDQYRISPCNINNFSSKNVMWSKKNNNYRMLFINIINLLEVKNRKSMADNEENWEILMQNI